MIFLLDYVEMWITFPPPFSYPKNKQILENWLIKLCTFNVAKYVHNYQICVHFRCKTEQFQKI